MDKGTMIVVLNALVKTIVDHCRTVDMEKNCVCGRVREEWMWLFEHLTQMQLSAQPWNEIDEYTEWMSVVVGRETFVQLDNICAESLHTAYREARRLARELRADRRAA